MSTTPAPLTEIEAMLSADQRRTVSVNDHLAFRESLARSADELDDLVADIRAAESNREESP